MAELEEISKRRNYTLTIDWNCSKCHKRTNIFGCYPGKNYRYGETVTWLDIVHKKCNKCDNLERPKRICSLCETEYDFDEVSCNKCDLVISSVIDTEMSYNEMKDRIKKGKRKKLDVSGYEHDIVEVERTLKQMGYTCCTVCGNVWLYDGNICYKCTEKNHGRTQL